MINLESSQAYATANNEYPQPKERTDCEFCGCDEGYHECECGQELTEKECHRNGGMCNDCSFAFHL